MVNPSEATLEEPGPGTRDHFQNIDQDKDTGYTNYTSQQPAPSRSSLSNRPAIEAASYHNGGAAAGTDPRPGRGPNCPSLSSLWDCRMGKLLTRIKGL